MRTTVWDEIGTRLRELAREEAVAASPPVRRARVLQGSPLIAETPDGERLDERDEDVEVDKALRDEPPEPGDVVRVHTAEDGDFIIEGLIRNG